MISNNYGLETNQIDLCPKVISYKLSCRPLVGKESKSSRFGKEQAQGVLIKIQLGGPCQYLGSETLHSINIWVLLITTRQNFKIGGLKV